MLRAGRRRSAGGHGAHGAARSRARLLRAHRSRATRGCLRLSMTRWGRPVVVVLALAVLASTMPLYQWVKKEYVPSDVDEAEFEMLVEGPEGMSLAAMDEALQAIDREVRAVPGVQLALLVTGSGRTGPGQPGQRLHPHRPPRRAHGHPAPVCGRGCGAGIRWPRSAATTRSATSCSRCASACASSATCASPSATSRASTSAAATSTSTSSCAGPIWRRWLATAIELRRRGDRAWRHARPQHHPASRSAGTARADRPRAGGRPARRHRADRHRPPSHGRRRPGGLALPRSRRSTRTTTSSCACARRIARDPRTISRLFVSRAGSRSQRGTGVGAAPALGLAPGGGWSGSTAS